MACRRAELSIGAACAVGLCDDPGLDALAGVLRSSSARSRSINGTERSERRRAAIRALQPHRHNARFAAGLPPIEKPPPNRSFWFVLLLILAVSLSGPLWLPYTGVTLPASVLVITSIISCAFAVVVFVRVHHAAT